MMKPGRTKTWIGLMFLNGQGCVGINLEFFSASSGVGLRIHSLVSETRLGQVCSQPDHVLKILPNLMGSHTIVTKIVMQNVPNDMLVLCFSVKPPRRTSLKINSEMTWLSFSFHYKRLNLYFTIKLVFEIRISHYIHVLACSCKTPNLAGDPAPGCTSLFTAHWSRLAIWSNTNKYTHCEGSHLKHKCSSIHFDENFIIVWVFLMRIPRLLEGFLDINPLFSSVCESEIPLWRHAVSSWVRCSWSHVIFVMKFTTSLWPLKPQGIVHAYECMGKNHVIPVILDEVAHKLGLVLLFRYGLCLSITYLENPRKLLCYFWWRHLQIRVSVTVQVLFMPINKSLFYLRWRRLQIRVSVTVQGWLMLFLMKALTD